LENHRLQKKLFLSWQGGIRLKIYLAAVLLKGMPEPFYIITTALGIPQKYST
jgi:hypothetical protein